MIGIFHVALCFSQLGFHLLAPSPLGILLLTLSTSSFSPPTARTPHEAKEDCQEGDSSLSLCFLCPLPQTGDCQPMTGAQTLPSFLQAPSIPHPSRFSIINS